jgi:hypothetical protein
VEIAAHARLIGNDRCVLRVSLAVAAVGRRGVVDGTTGDVEQFLLVLDEHGDQQCRAAGVEIGGPKDAAAIS